MSIREAQSYQTTNQVKLVGSLLLGTFVFLAIGFKEGNIFAILPGFGCASVIGYLIYLGYKKDAEKNLVLHQLKRKQVEIVKRIKMQDGEILLLSQDISTPEKGFKNIICVSPRHNEIFWIADLVSEVYEKYEDIELENGQLEATTSNGYRATLNIGTGEIIHSWIKEKASP